MDWSNLTRCVLNAYLSYTATMLNIVAIYAIRKTPSLSKNLKTLLLSLAVSDLGVGLLAQPLYVTRLAMDSTQKNVTYNTIFNAFLILTNLFTFASLFSVTALCADRFLAICLHLRYQELVTYQTVVASVVFIWMFSALISLISLFISKKTMNVIFVVIVTVCITTATSMSVKLYLTTLRHINQIRVTQVALNGQVESLQRKRKSAMASLFLYFATIVCCLPHICRLFITAAISEPGVYVQYFRFYALTLVFLNSTLNPLIYCWKMTQIRNTVIDKLREVFSSTFQWDEASFQSAFGTRRSDAGIGQKKNSPYVSCSCHPFIV